MTAESGWLGHQPAWPQERIRRQRHCSRLRSCIAAWLPLSLLLCLAAAAHAADEGAQLPKPEPGDDPWNDVDNGTRGGAALLEANNGTSRGSSGSPASQPTTGTSKNNPDDYPVPDDYEEVMVAVHRIVGPYVIKSRDEMEMAFHKAFADYFKPLNVEVRWLNYTVRPSTSIGLVGSYLRSSMRAVDEQVIIYQKKGVGNSRLELGTVYNQSAYLQQLVTTQYGFSDASLVVVSEVVTSKDYRNSLSTYGAASTIVELDGRGLFPFTVDKQNVVLLTLTKVFNSLERSPVFYVNISNFAPDGHPRDPNSMALAPSPEPAPRRGRRKLLQDAAASAPQLPAPSGQAGTVRVEIWTGLSRLGGINMEDLWNRTLNQANAQKVYVINGDNSIDFAFTYRNFTTTSQYYGLQMTGSYVSSQLFKRSGTGEYTIAYIPPAPAGGKPGGEGAPQLAPFDPESSAGGTNDVVGRPLGPGDGEGLQLGPGSMPLVESVQRKTNVGLIVGVVVAGVVVMVLALLVFAAVLLRRRQRAVAAGKGLSASEQSDTPQSGGSSISGGGSGGQQHPWAWDAPMSGVTEPVVLPRSKRDEFPSLHRADQLFGNDTANHSRRSTPGSSVGSSADSYASCSPKISDGGSLHRATSSGPFVAGELDPSEIEICRDENGRRIVLGEGAFGRVYKGLRRGVHEVAVKQMGNLKDPQLIRQFRKEIAIMGRVSFQPNIVNFYGACLREPVQLVMELMEGGDLRHALSNDEREEYSWWGKGRSLALDIAHGLHFLHSSGVTHRDLKTSNILLSKDGNTAKIGDVGLAKITLTDLQTSVACVGTFVYCAPELLMGERCTEKADIFSFSVCLWEIVTGEVPQRGYLRDVAVPGECPEEVRQLLGRCMSSDPDARPSAEELVRLLAAAPHERPAAEALAVQESGVSATSRRSSGVQQRPLLQDLSPFAGAAAQAELATVARSISASNKRGGAAVATHLSTIGSGTAVAEEPGRGGGLARTKSGSGSGGGSLRGLRTSSGGSGGRPPSAGGKSGGVELPRWR